MAVPAREATRKAFGLAAGLSLAIGAALLGRTELAAIRLIHQAEALPLWAWDAPALAMIAAAAPRGADSRRRLLTACQSSIGDPPSGLVPAPAMAPAADMCRHLAERILQSSPTDALAHVARAQALVRLDRPDLARAALARAQRNSRADGWMTRQRLRIAFDPAADAVLDYPGRGADIAHLSTLNDGPKFLARLHRSRPLSRKPLLAVLERQPAEIQQDFLRALRRLAQ